jgi:hypothetical protein
MADDTELRVVEQSEDAPYLKTLSNGAIYDTRIGRIVSSKGVTNKITTENAAALSRRRQELKRDAIWAGAQSAVGKVKKREPVHEFEFLEVLGEVNMLRAMDRNNVKGVDASRFLIQETGIAEAKQAETVNNTMNVYEMPADVAAAIMDIRQRLHEQSQGSIDGLVTETDISVSNKVRIDDSKEGDDGSPAGTASDT